MKVLITGGLGFIGWNLTQYLLHYTDWKLVILDNLSNNVVEKINEKNVTLFVGNILDDKSVKQALTDCDIVIHLAASCGVVDSIANPFDDLETNVTGLVNILWHSVKHNVKHVIFISSNAASHSLSPYGAGKRAGESYCSAFATCYNLPCTVLRFSNVYGPFCDRKKSVVAIFIRKMMDNHSVLIYGDGKQTRDFLYVDDACQAILKTVDRDLTDCFKLFQIGTGMGTSIFDLYKLLKKVSDFDVPACMFPPRDGEVMCSVSDINQAKQCLGFEPSVALNEGLKRTVEAMKKMMCKV